MPFDPEKFIKENSGQEAFDPEAFLKENGDEGFNPDEFLKENEMPIRTISPLQDVAPTPGIGQVVDKIPTLERIVPKISPDEWETLSNATTKTLATNVKILSDIASFSSKTVAGFAYDKLYRRVTKENPILDEKFNKGELYIFDLAGDVWDKNIQLQKELLGEDFLEDSRARMNALIDRNPVFTPGGAGEAGAQSLKKMLGINQSYFQNLEKMKPIFAFGAELYLDPLARIRILKAPRLGAFLKTEDGLDKLRKFDKAVESMDSTGEFLDGIKFFVEQKKKVREITPLFTYEPPLIHELLGKDLTTKHLRGLAKGVVRAASKVTPKAIKDVPVYIGKARSSIAQKSSRLSTIVMENAAKYKVLQPAIEKLPKITQAFKEAPGAIQALFKSHVPSWVTNSDEFNVIWSDYLAAHAGNDAKISAVVERFKKEYGPLFDDGTFLKFVENPTKHMEDYKLLSEDAKEMYTRALKDLRNELVSVNEKALNLKIIGVSTFIPTKNVEMFIPHVMTEDARVAIKKLIENSKIAPGQRGAKLNLIERTYKQRLIDKPIEEANRMFRNGKLEVGGVPKGTKFDVDLFESNPFKASVLAIHGQTKNIVDQTTIRRLGLIGSNVRTATHTKEVLEPIEGIWGVKRKFFPKEIARRIGWLVNKDYRGTKATYIRRATNVFKANAIMSVGYHYDSAIDDLFRAYSTDTGIKELSESANMLFKKDVVIDTVFGKMTTKEVMKYAVRYGLIDSSTVSDILQTSQTMFDIGSWYPWRRDFFGYRINRMMSDGRTNWVKLGTFISELKKGSTPMEAAAFANKIYFNYKDVTPIIDWIRSFGIPFITEPVKKISDFIPYVAKNPGKFLNAYKTLDYAEQAVTGLSRKELQAYKAGAGIREPSFVLGRDKSGAVIALRKSMFDIAGRISPEDWKDFIQNFTPWSKLMVSAYTQIDPATRRPIIPERFKDDPKMAPLFYGLTLFGKAPFVPTALFSRIVNPWLKGKHGEELRILLRNSAPGQLAFRASGIDLGPTKLEKVHGKKGGLDMLVAGTSNKSSTITNAIKGVVGGALKVTDPERNCMIQINRLFKKIESRKKELIKGVLVEGAAYKLKMTKGKDFEDYRESEIEKTSMAIQEDLIQLASYAQLLNIFIEERRAAGAPVLYSPLTEIFEKASTEELTMEVDKYLKQNSKAFKIPIKDVYQSEGSK